MFLPASVSNRSINMDDAKESAVRGHRTRKLSDKMKWI